MKSDDALAYVLEDVARMLKERAGELRANSNAGGMGAPGVDDRLVTCREAAVLMRVSPSWLYGKARAGAIPFARMLPGRGVRFSLAGVREWLAGQAARPPAEPAA